MKITIETSESERVALRPEDQPLMRQASTTSTGMEAAIDGGPPREELLQALASRGSSAASATMNAAAQEAPYSMVMAGGEPSQSRH